MRLHACISVALCAAVWTAAAGCHGADQRLQPSPPQVVVAEPSLPFPEPKPFPEGPHPRALAWSNPPLPRGATLRIGPSMPYHSGRQAAFSHDGRLLAWSWVGGTPREPRAGLSVEEVATGKQVLAIAWKNEPVRHLAFSPNAAQLAVLSFDGTLRILRVADGSVAVEAELGKGVLDLAYSSDGTTIAVAQSPSTALLLEAASARRFTTLEHPGGRLVKVGFTSTGIFLTMGQGGWTRWRGRVPDFHPVPKELGRIEYSSEIVYTQSPVRDQLAIATKRGTLVATVDGEILAWLPGATRIAFTADGASLLTNDPGGGPEGVNSMMRRDLAGQREAVRVAKYLPGKLIVSPDGRTLATLSGRINLFDLPTGRPIPDDGFVGGITQLAYGPDGRELYGYGMFTSYRWDAETGALLEETAHPGAYATHIEASPSGKGVLLKSDGIYVVRKAGQTTKLPEMRDARSARFASESQVVFASQSPDASRWTDRVMRWDLSTGEVAQIGADINGKIVSLFVDLDRRQFVLTTESSKELYEETFYMEVRDLATGKKIRTFKTRPGCWPEGVRRDATVVAFCINKTADRLIPRWYRFDMKRGNVVAKSDPIASDMPYGLAHGGSLAAYGGLDGLHILETQRFTEVAVLPSAGAHAFAPGGDRVAVVSPDGSIVVYQIPLGR